MGKHYKTIIKEAKQQLTEKDEGTETFKINGKIRNANWKQKK